MNLAALERTEVQQLVVRLGAPGFHGRQVFRWIHQRGARGFEAMTDLPATLRSELARSSTIDMPVIDERHTSVDGTTKFRLRLSDGRHIEAVYIPDTPRQTFCISTQVGCAMACAFCLTGKMGLVRNLDAAEIVGQVRALADATGLAGQSINIVLMGMGEPLHNDEATLKALRMLQDPDGLAIPARRMTLSTVGLVPALERLAQEPDMPNIAISLHATTDESRDRLVPVNRKYDLAALIEACKRMPLHKRRRITFEYVLLDRVNDTPADARRLVALLSGLRAKVNLLPLNEAAGIPFSRPSDVRVNEFAAMLAERGLTVSVRRSRGRDIRAACGQLIVEGERASAGEKLAERLSERTGAR